MRAILIVIIALLTPLIQSGGDKSNVEGSGGGSHSFTAVQSWTCTNTGGGGSGSTLITCTALSGLGSGNTIIFVVPVVGGCCSVISAPSKGTLTLWPATPDTGYGQYQNGVITGISGGTTSFTITGGTRFSTTTYYAEEVSGVSSTGTVATSAGFADNFSAPAGTGSVTVSGGGAWEICGFISNDDGAAVYTVGAGYTSLILLSGAQGFELECSTAVKTAGTYNPGITATNDTFTYGTVAFALN